MKIRLCVELENQIIIGNIDELTPTQCDECAVWEFEKQMLNFKIMFNMNTNVKISNSAPVVWGVNKFGQEVKEHDKLSCGNGHDTWFTHVIFYAERNCWHREQDYYHSRVVGSYNGC